jgi:hypothetical protein
MVLNIPSMMSNAYREESRASPGPVPRSSVCIQVSSSSSRSRSRFWKSMEDFVPAGDLECQATVKRYGASDPVSTIADLCDTVGKQGAQNPPETEDNRKGAIG